MQLYSLFGLFVISFGAATILPISSEIVFASLILGGSDVYQCVITASLGNWLGGMTNYFIGRAGKTEWIEKYLKINAKQIEKTQIFLQGKGALMAFFCFLPVVGDVIALVLGILRANFLLVNISMFSGKLLRYIFLYYGLKHGTVYFNL